MLVTGVCHQSLLPTARFAFVHPPAASICHQRLLELTVVFAGSHLSFSAIADVLYKLNVEKYFRKI
jgi:hypothetical protein